MYTYSVGGGFGKPDLLFSTEAKAEKVVLERIREFSSCGFSYAINMLSLDSFNNNILSIKYSGMVEERANLKYIEVSKTGGIGSPVNFSEVITIYLVSNEEHLITSQLWDIDKVKYKSIYFSDIKIFRKMKRFYASRRIDLGSPKEHPGKLSNLLPFTSWVMYK